ncbi:OmpA family protein [Sphingomonas sp. BIUV-7]|uniref:OmpA family protein n=1 Tax=Sphingomonas natans TaxID=3063330 RepID=A0ABT8YDY5_9SPHN|nr:OmpA family protein [Sphingomonas sp. BIUV-7]MDO6416557.1 OmpA family protein [Sphingomonas sp. BIUV-7]
MKAISARWAVSFADLCLLLLGFLILAQAKPDRAKLAAGMPDAPSAPPPEAAQLIAGRLFEPGEALLTQAGRAQIAAFAARAGTGSKGARIRLESLGADRATSRLDAWELAAARAAAVARALVSDGIGEERILLAIDRTEGRPQRLSLVAE